MDDLCTLPNSPLTNRGPITKECLERGWSTFRQAALGIQAMPYGYNAAPVTIDSLFRDGRGTCITKHAALATCAREMGLDLRKAIGIYVMDDALVSGLGGILAPLGLKGVPASHCFLTSGPYRYDLTEGNCNGKNGPVESYLYIEVTEPLPDEAVEAAIVRWGLEVFLEREGLADNQGLVLKAQALCAAHLKNLLSCAI